MQLAVELLEHRPLVRSRLAPGDDAIAALDARLADLYRAGSGAWPDLPLSDVGFVRALAAHVEPEGPVVPETFHCSDFFLAAACTEGVPGAVTALDRGFLSRIPSYIARVCRDSDREKPEDIAQSIAEHVVVPSGTRPPRIAEYSGKGPLGGWLRVLSVRLALNSKRTKDRFVSESAAPHARSEVDPELDLFRMKYRDELEVAFEAAFATLDDEQRLLLRLHSSGTHRGEDIAKILGVDRSTAVRRLARARELLLTSTKSLMTAKLGISPTEFDSIARAVYSQIELTLSRVLAPRS